MRALVYHGPNDIGVEERVDPEPGPGEVLLRITATGICGSDLHGYTGENKRRHPGQIMGHETVGRIVVVGPDVSDPDLEPGRVATVNPVIGCGECAQCAAGTEQLCPRRKVIGVDREIASAFAELMLAPARNVVVLRRTCPRSTAPSSSRCRWATTRRPAAGSGRTTRSWSSGAVPSGRRARWPPVGSARSRSWCPSRVPRGAGWSRSWASPPSIRRPVTSRTRCRRRSAGPRRRCSTRSGPAGRSATACAPRRSAPGSCWSAWAPAS